MVDLRHLNMRNIIIGLMYRKIYQIMLKYILHLKNNIIQCNTKLMDRYLKKLMMMDLIQYSQGTQMKH